MSATKGLSGAEPLHEWVVVRRDIARLGRCQCPNCNAPLRSGVAYIAIDQNDNEFELGPECAKKYTTDHNKPDVPDITGEMGSLLRLKRRPSKRGLIGRYIDESSDKFIERMEKRPRRLDERYLLLRAKKLRDLKIHPTSQTLIDVWNRYIQNPQYADLSPIRQMRELAEVGGQEYSLKSLLKRYAYAEYINRFLHPDQYRETLDGKKYNPAVNPKDFVEPYRVLKNKDEADRLTEDRKRLIKAKEPVETDLLNELIFRVFERREVLESGLVLVGYLEKPKETQADLFCDGMPVAPTQSRDVPGPVLVPENNLMLTAATPKAPKRKRQAKSYRPRIAAPRAEAEKESRVGTLKFG